MITVDWTDPGGEGLRERKKRQTRQLLTDTATEMFLDRGFDAVRVAEVAAACGVSEKTVYNYFPTKESLVVDHPDTAIATLRPALASAKSPVDAVLTVLAGELRAVASWLASQPDAVERFARFAALIDATPPLRAYQREMAGRLVGVIAEAIAARAGVPSDDPEPQIVAIALVGLWRVQFAALARYVDGRPASELVDAVTADVRRAADLLVGGLGGCDQLGITRS
ncbi:TetR/AcrR family transcriptional regulator [Kutzneria buriramensis]|uniref:AcrR family transcriptional regulator n=1 Tax=Kutzneria buriramensis TaxID=1045776 RepID=A0A3E0HF25_9PSEU|nr:TetR family transcriptional regulator [Kutzneria buriramensis]REH43783.1 AcrR family transcriptional regulator [Kutzneria buriramensis]